MHFDWIFGPLGIEETKDKSQIKKAYAQKVKECHPEEHPEEWQRLHQAYKDALNYASGKYFFCYDEIDIDEEYQAEPVEQAEGIEEPSSDLEDLSLEEIEPTQKSIFKDLVAQADIINASDIGSITRQLENLSKLTGDSLHIGWRNFFDSVAFLEFYEERSVINLLGSTLKEVQVPKETAELIQEQLELRIKKLLASKKYYKADLMTAIRDDFNNRKKESCNQMKVEEESLEGLVKQRTEEPTKLVEETKESLSNLKDSSLEKAEPIENDTFENSVTQVGTINASGIESIAFQLENLTKSTDESLCDRWESFFDSEAFLELYGERSVIDLLGTTLKEIQVSREVAEYIQNKLELVISKLCDSEKYYKADLLTAIRDEFNDRKREH